MYSEHEVTFTHRIDFVLAIPRKPKKNMYAYCSGREDLERYLAFIENKKHCKDVTVTEFDKEVKFNYHYAEFANAA